MVSSHLPLQDDVVVLLKSLHSDIFHTNSLDNITTLLLHKKIENCCELICLCFTFVKHGVQQTQTYRLQVQTAKQWH